MGLRRATALLLPLLALAACEEGTTSGKDDKVAPPPMVAVYAPTGAIQCGDPGVALDVHQRQLDDAGIRVFAASCGHDGLARIEMCGAASGNLNVFRIPPGRVKDAVALGFGVVADLPQFTDMACPQSPEQVRVYRPTGQRQCDPAVPVGDTIRLADAAGIAVLGATCGSDGLVRPTVCGIGAGSIHILDIPPGDMPHALDAGFAPVETLGGRVEHPC